MTSWRDIRDLRANPSGYAKSDERRRDVFGASLQQAEGLAQAATDLDYATRPILLFYALSQGFRAVCAAQLSDEWERSGHGLTFKLQGDVIDSVVSPRPATSDLYSGAMSAIDETCLPGRVSTGELLATLVELRDVPLGSADLPRPLILRSPHSQQELSDPDAPAPADQLTVLVDGLPLGLSREELRDSLRAYPGLDVGTAAPFPTGVATGLFAEEENRNGVCYRRPMMATELFPVITIPFSGSTVAAYQRAYEALGGPTAGERLVRVIQPGVGEGRWQLGPLTPWWALLLGLSSLARYEPANWRRTLAIDSSPLAPALERVIDSAATMIPFFIYHALVRDD